GRGGRAHRAEPRQVGDAGRAARPATRGRWFARRGQLPPVFRETFPNVLLALDPSVVMAAMHTTMIRASMTAYSTAVGPSSRFRKVTNCLVKLRMTVSGPGTQDANRDTKRDHCVGLFARTGELSERGHQLPSSHAQSMQTVQAVFPPPLVSSCQALLPL